jgi:hypothetical protein
MRHSIPLAGLLFSAAVLAGCSSSTTIYARFTKGDAPAIAVLNHDPAADGTTLLDDGRLALNVESSDGTTKRIHTKLGANPNALSATFNTDRITKIIADADAPEYRYEEQEVPLNSLTNTNGASVWLLITLQPTETASEVWEDGFSMVQQANKMIKFPEVNGAPASGN